MSFDQAVAVPSTKAEYEYVHRQKCRCGASYFADGARPELTQSLIFDGDKRPFDRLRVTCVKCKTPQDFWFDISAFYGRPVWNAE